MAQVATRGVLLLDAGGISAIAAGEPAARAVLDRARREGRFVAIPAAVLVEVVSGRPMDAPVDRVIKAVGATIELTAARARAAGALRARALRSLGAAGDDRPPSVVDATVMAEAVAAKVALILTSDPDDMERLRDAAGNAGAQIVILRV